MNADARLAAALRANAAPARDPAFTLAVIRATEAQRFRADAALAMLRWGGLTAATACLGLLVAGWTGAHWDEAQSGILGAAGIFALVAAARLMTQRLAPAALR